MYITVFFSNRRLLHKKQASVAQTYKNIVDVSLSGGYMLLVQQTPYRLQTQQCYRCLFM